MSVWLSWGGGPPGDTGAADLGTRAAAALLGVPAAGLRLVHGPGGAPHLAGEAAGRASVSVAHSRGLAAAAVTTLGPVGVDVELVRPLDALALARRWFRPEESDWLAALPGSQRVAAFLCLWTQKEAVGKALGTGLAGGRGLRRAVLAPVPLPGPDGLRLAALPDAGDQGAPLSAAVARLAGAGAERGRDKQSAGVGEAERGGRNGAVPVVLAVACRHAGAAGAPVTVRYDPAP